MHFYTQVIKELAFNCSYNVPGAIPNALHVCYEHICLIR